MTMCASCNFWNTYFDLRCVFALQVQTYVFQITSIILALYMGSSGVLFGQEVTVEVSYDTVYAGNIVAVRYSMENWQAEMDQPEFGEFEVAGGPQISSSMSISGGERSSSKTVIMLLRPPDLPGKYVLPSITFKGEDIVFETEEKTIIVVENSEGRRQDPVFENQPPKSFNRQYKRSDPPRGKRQRF